MNHDLDLAQDAIARMQACGGLAAEKIAQIRAYVAAEQQNKERALTILAALSDCLVEEQHPELADMCDAIDAALRGTEARELVA